MTCTFNFSLPEKLLKILFFFPPDQLGNCFLEIVVYNSYVLVYICHIFAHLDTVLVNLGQLCFCMRFHIVMPVAILQ